MKYKIDLHTHSNVSTHAYNTIDELINEALEKGLLAIALTNHGPSMPDAPHPYHFANLKVLPEFIRGIRLYKGIEANIISTDGDIDLPQKYKKELEIVLAGFHGQTAYSEDETKETNTRTLINVIKKGEVDILAHLGNPTYSFDHEEVVKCASENMVAIEINNSSFGKSRSGSKENCLNILKLCKKYNCFISLGSDTHYKNDIGNFSNIESYLEEYQIYEEKILNSSLEVLERFLRNRRTEGN